MDFTKGQAKAMVELKGEGLFPSKIADTFGFPRGSVRKFFKERRRAAERGLVKPEAEPVTVVEMLPVALPPALGPHRNFEAVKRLKAEGHSLRDMADAAGVPYNNYRAWYASMVGQEKIRSGTTKKEVAAKNDSNSHVKEAPMETPTFEITPDQWDKANELYDTGTHWHDIAFFLGVPSKALQTWRMRKLKAAKATHLTENAAKEPIEQEQSDMPEDIVTLTEDEPDWALVAYVWNGYMITHDVNIMNTENVRDLISLYNSLKGVK